ncbi:YadA C-terminal domain-containing protein [Acinetobacter sp.]|uniref:YadA C-terminal domain-containing protein n=1 Tax=Acinetobacter sp. TaxID=472 RepID=UPI0031DF23B8
MKLKHQILTLSLISILNTHIRAEDVVTENLQVKSPYGAVVASISAGAAEDAYFYMQGESYIYGTSTVVGELKATELNADNIRMTDNNNNTLLEVSEQNTGKANLYLKGYGYISDDLVVDEKIITKDLEVKGTIRGNVTGNIVSNYIYAKFLESEKQRTQSLEVTGHLNAKNIDLQGTNISSLADATQDNQAVNLRQLNAASTKNLADAKTYTDNTAKTLRDENKAEFVKVNKAMQDGDKETLALANKAIQDGDQKTLALAYKNTTETATTIRSEMERASINVLNNSKSYTDFRVDRLNEDLQSFKKDSYAATAASLATASLPQPSNAGYSMVSAGTGTWKGQQGFAVGMSGISEDNKVIYKLAGTGNTQGDFGGSAAIGYQW